MISADPPRVMQQVTAGKSSITRDSIILPTYLLAAGLILGQRFAFMIAGFPFQMCFILAWAILVWMAGRESVYVDSMRLTLYLVLVGSFCLLFLANPSQGTFTSLGILFTIYLAFLLRLDISYETYKVVLRVYQNLMLLVALLGLAQFGLQFLISSPALFSFYDVLPDSVLIPGFNTAIPIRYGETIYKSNGLLLLEPSTFSQFLAIAIIIELLYFESKIRLAIYVVAMVFSYSGTGVILLAIFVPIVLFLRQKLSFLILIILGAMVIIFFASELNIDVYVTRSQEFTSEKSSAFHRFIGPFYLINQFSLADPRTFFLGSGAGSIEEYLSISVVPSHDPAWAKLLLEYGLVGSLTFLAFLIYAMFSQTHSRLLSSVFLLKFLFLGGMLVSQMDNMLAVLLVVLPSKDQIKRRPDGAYPGKKRYWAGNGDRSYQITLRKDSEPKRRCSAVTEANGRRVCPPRFPEPD